jgi:hypothetical protein
LVFLEASVSRIVFYGQKRKLKDEFSGPAIQGFASMHFGTCVVSAHTFAPTAARRALRLRALPAATIPAEEEANPTQATHPGLISHFL